MLRLVILSLLFFTITSCMAQTFQYSRGWTNGKRSSLLTKTRPQQQTQELKRFFTREENSIDPELLEDVERYFMEMPRFMRNALLARSLRPPTSFGSGNSNGLENGNSNIFANRHQSNELFDDGAGVMETNDFAKH